MAIEFRGNRKQKLADLLTNLALTKLANCNISDEGELFPLQLLAGPSRDKPAMRRAGSNKLAHIVRRALRLHTTAELATKMGVELHEIWHAHSHGGIQ